MEKYNLKPIEGQDRLREGLLATYDGLYLNALREWRRKSLDTNFMGRLAVRAYYKFGPKIARLMKSHPGLKRPFKSRLDSLVKYVKSR